MGQISFLQKTNAELNIKLQQSERKSNDYLQTIMNQQKMLDEEKSKFQEYDKHGAGFQSKLVQEQMQESLKKKTVTNYEKLQ